MFDVSLYGCSIRDSTRCPVPSPSRPTVSSTLAQGLILSPHRPEDDRGQAHTPPSNPNTQPSTDATEPSRSPTLVYRHTSCPLEASCTSVVLNHLTIVVLFTPLLRIYRFFTQLGPDPLLDHAAQRCHTIPTPFSHSNQMSSLMSSLLV